MNESNTAAANNAAAKKPIFQSEHYDAIAELLGQKIVYGMMDENDYRIIEAFSEMFAQDNPITFDKDRFKNAVYEAHSRRVK
jgi:Sec7-like guanine-nucleotide exchange factor